MTYSKHSLLIQVAVLFTALFFTIGIFLSLVPAVPRYSYWVAMIDVSLMVIVTGVYGIYNFQLSLKNTVNRLPVAMRIGIGSTISIFLVASVVTVLIFFWIFNYSHYDLVYLLVVLGKWLLLILVSVVMWSIVQEGEGIPHGRSRDEQIALLKVVQQTLIEFRQLSPDSKGSALQRKIDDELSTIRNQIRSHASANQMRDDEHELISNLLNEVRSTIHEISSSPESDHVPGFMRIHDAVQKILVTSQFST